MGDTWENEDQFPEQLVVTSSSSEAVGYNGDSLQPNDDVSHQHLAHYEQELQKPLSKDQKYRRRRKAKEQFKDRYIEMLNQENLRLKSENEMVRKDKDEQLAHLTSEIEKLKQEITLIKYYNNLPML